jgi:hypothetical protein
MAITKTIEIDVNSQGATSGINNITNSIEQTDKATQSLRSQLRQAQAEVGELSEKFGATSKEAIEAAKRAGQLKDAIGDAKALTDAFNPDAKFSALSGSLGGVASGFSAVEGSLALAGVQSENLQETMVRLQAAMALSQGLQGLGESIDSFKQMGAVAKNALAGIRTGIAATGIGVLLVALGAVVAYWDDIKEAVGGVSSEQEELNTLAQTNLDTEQDKFNALSLQENTLKLQGKSEKDILKMKIAQTDQMIKASEIQIEQSIATTKAQTEAAKRNQDILAGVLKFLSIPLTMILKTVDAVGSALGKDFGLEEKVFKGISSLVFDPKETQAEGDKVVAEQRKALDKLKNDRAGLQLSVNNIDNQANKEAADKRKEANDKAIQSEKDKADALERIRQGEIDTEAERRAEELRQVQEQYKLLIAEAEKYYGKNSEKVLSLKEAQLTKEKELTDKFKTEDTEKQKAKTLKEQEEKIKNFQLSKEFDNLSFEEKREELKTKEAILLEDKTLTEEQKNAVEKQYSDEKIKIAQAEATAKAAIQEQVFSVAESGISLVKGLFEKNKSFQKAALIAESAIGIAKMITANNAANIGALATPQAIATSGASAIPVIALNNIKTAIGVAATIAATAKGLSALGGGGAPSGGSVGGGGGGGGATAPAPQFNVVGNSGVNQIAQTLGAQQPVQAYVVASNVTTQQSLDRNIVANASLG